MTLIQDPTYSRPIDVHRWSDHPEVKALVDDLWEGYLPETITGKVGGNGRTGIVALSAHCCRSLLTSNDATRQVIPDIGWS